MSLIGFGVPRFTGLSLSRLPIRKLRLGNVVISWFLGNLPMNLSFVFSLVNSQCFKGSTPGLGLATWEFTNENEKPNSLVNSPVANFSNPGVELLKHWELTNEFEYVN